MGRKCYEAMQNKKQRPRKRHINYANDGLEQRLYNGLATMAGMQC